MSRATQSIRLLVMEIRHEHDVVLCRQRARQFAAALGFTPRAQIRLATALSEIARNAFQYARGGKVDFSFVTEPRASTPARPQQRLVIVVRDAGPGIAALDEIMAGRYHSPTGLGLGILGAHRLMDRLEIVTSSQGTTMTMQQNLPLDIPVRSPAQVQKIVDELLRQAPTSAMEEMQLQNQELIRAINDAKAREEDVKRVNQELAETNAGVLALYDELDTLHRVSLLLASQLDLKALIQSIIDVTTELTNADLGAFYFSAEGAELWNLYATSGPKREILASAGASYGAEFFGTRFVEDGLFRTPDLELHPERNCASEFAKSLAGHLRVRSCLAVPIVGVLGELLGAMIFASAEVDRFTERSERIVGSIAAQAVVGIEKSQLFHAVKATNAAKDQFIAMLSHELRTPLNPVLAIVSSWKGDTNIPEGIREDLSVIARNVRLEARLIDDLLDFSKSINGKVQFDRSLVDVHQIIGTVIEICRTDLEAAGQQIQRNFLATQTSVSGDAARLQQVLWNVLKNAIKFSLPAGLIEVTTSNPRTDLIRVVILDHGRGIEPESLAQIFGAFEQGKPQILARFGGLGLGLAIAKTFVERHGGTISATSQGLDRGAEFTIDLPFTQAEVKKVEQDLSLAEAGKEKTKARILLVEDHDDTRNTLTRLLGRKGHQVIPAPNGNLARIEFARGEFDLIISDLGLPDGSGLELITRLREIHITPAIALSGYGMESDIVSSKAAGFDSHLTKPIDFEQLLNTVERLVATP